jgi:hypothetical protein
MNSANTATSASSGSEATLNDQLARDTTGKLRDEVLDELAVAADTLEEALNGNVNGTNARVLRDLLAAIRLGETIVTETWSSVHA